MHRIDGAGHVGSRFVGEDPATNRPPTEITPEILNAFQEELAAVIEAAQIALDKANNGQLLQALRSAGVFQTAAQFDASTKVATTEFLDRALGSYRRDMLTVVANTTLTSADIGKTVRVNSPSVVTLPLASSVPLGSVVPIVVNNLIVSTIRLQGADVFGAGASSSTADILLSGGDTLLLEATSSSAWAPLAGSGALKFSTGVLGSSLGSSGWKKIPDFNAPNGFILEQWGSVTVNSGAEQTFSLPIAFPSAFVRAVGIIDWSTVTPFGAGGYVEVGRPSLTQISLRHSAVSARTVGYIARGY